MAQRIGTVVTAPMRINDDTIQYPIVYGEEVQGGAHSGPTLASRDALAVWYRQFGMTFRVYNDATNNGNYILTYGKTSTDPSDNGNWVLDPGSGAGSNNVKKLDQVILNNGTINLPANCMLYSVLINAMAEFTAFAVGYTSAMDDVVMSQDIPAGYSQFQKGLYIPTPTTLYFSGITTQSTCSVIIFQF